MRGFCGEGKGVEGGEKEEREEKGGGRGGRKREGSLECVWMWDQRGQCRS